MMGIISGKITGFNERGFLIVSEGGHETQIGARRHEYEGILQIGDEVRVYGGGSSQDPVFLTAWISVFRDGQWIRTGELRKDPVIKLGTMTYFVIFGSLILGLIFLATVILAWWYILR